MSSGEIRYSVEFTVDDCPNIWQHPTPIWLRIPIDPMKRRGLSTMRYRFEGQDSEREARDVVLREFSKGTFYGGWRDDNWDVGVLKEVIEYLFSKVKPKRVRKSVEKILGHHLNGRLLDERIVFFKGRFIDTNEFYKCNPSEEEKKLVFGR